MVCLISTVLESRGILVKQPRVAGIGPSGQYPTPIASVRMSWSRLRTPDFLQRPSRCTRPWTKQTDELGPSSLESIRTLNRNVHLRPLAVPERTQTLCCLPAHSA